MTSAKVDGKGPLAVFLELNGPEHPVARVAAFLRQDAVMQRTTLHHRWDVPETMARAYENAARILDEHLAALRDRGGVDDQGGG